MKLTPRDYQDYAAESPFRYFMEGGTGNPLIAMPTGTGKSIVIGAFVERVLTRYPGQRIMMTTHVKELIEQNFEKLLKMWPSAPAGIYSAGLKRRDTHLPITYAGVGSVAKRAHEFGRVDLLIIDEAHLLSPGKETMYQKLISDLKEVNPHLKVIGLTATPYRMGQGLLTEDGIFTDFAVDMTDMASFNWFIQQGYLSRLIPKRTSKEIDLTGVGTVAGEYNQKQLAAATDQEEMTYAAIREAVELGADRKKWLVFTVGIEHCSHVQAMLESFGVEAWVVHSKMNDDDRNDAIETFRHATEQTALVNFNVLTTGFDVAEIDLIVILRPTKSTNLWVQMLGRGTRPVYAEGYDLSTKENRLAAMEAGQKQNCLVLDFAGNTKRLGPINDPVIPKKKGSKGGGSAPIKICENCGTYNHSSLRVCIECGAEFPRVTKIVGEASSDALIAEESLPKVEPFEVTKVIYTKHTKPGRPPSLRVDYYCGLRRFKEFVCLEHPGPIQNKAKKWWLDRSEDDSAPVSVDNALKLTNSLKQPKKVNVWINKKYPEVMNYEFTD